MFHSTLKAPEARGFGSDAKFASNIQYIKIIIISGMLKGL